MDGKISILGSRYAYLLFSLIAFFLVNPFLTASHFSDMILCFFFSLVIIFSFPAMMRNRYFVTLMLILGLFSYASYWYILWIDPSKTAYVIHFTFNILFLSLINFSVIHAITKHREITADTLFGAICAYLLIGFIWSFVYLLIATIDPSSFSIHMDHDPVRARIDHFIYYSFVTLTTVGYGDILAMKSVARTFSWLEAVIGQVYLAVWISQLVGLRILQAKNSD